MEKIAKKTEYIMKKISRGNRRVSPLIKEPTNNVSRQKKSSKRKLSRKYAINPEEPPTALLQNQRIDESSDDEDDCFSVSDKICNNEELFCDVYHQCANLVGKDNYNEFGSNALINHLRYVFEFSNDKSKTLINDIREKERPKLLLKVDVLKTKDIPARDIFSVEDLFYVLWISSSPKNYSYGKLTKGKLKPTKQETFNLLISTSTEDILHIQLWDFDPTKIIDEEKSDTVQSIVEDDINEPLGSAQIQLKDIETEGEKMWLTLKKPSRNISFGKILLEMSFGTEENIKNALEKHEYLLKVLLRRVMKEKNNNLIDWKGKFCEKDEIILRQHRIQSNLSKNDDLVAQWAGYAEVVNNPVNFWIFDDLSDKLLNLRKDELLVKKKKKYYWNSTKKILASCYDNIKNIRKTTVNQKQVYSQLHSILSILQNFSNYQIPSDINLFPSELYNWIEHAEELSFRTVLHEAVVQGANDWFDSSMTENEPGNDTEEAKLEQMIKVAEIIKYDIEEGQDYQGLFEKKQKFSYAKTIFAVYQQKITETMASDVHKMCEKIKLNTNNTWYYQDNDNSVTFFQGSSMSALFFTVQEIEKIGREIFKNDYDMYETFPLREFHQWFLPVVVVWLDIVTRRIMKQIENEVKMDNFTPVDLTVKHSSSAVDVMTTLNLLKEFFDQLEWPNVEDRCKFITKVVQNILKGTIHYANLIISKMKDIPDDVEKRMYSVDDWCVAVNNIDYVHNKIKPFIEKLGVDKLIDLLSESTSSTSSEIYRVNFEKITLKSYDIVGKRITDLLREFSKKMEPSMERFLQEGAVWLHQEAKLMDCLVDYLDENLVSLNVKLYDMNFDHILDVMWESISQIVFKLSGIAIENKQPPEYFSNLQECLHILLQYFKIQDKITQLKYNKLQDILSKSERILTLYGMKTSDLVHLYYLERLDEQDQLETPENGLLTVQVQTNHNKLFVEILNASNIIPMDSNGQSDPFVCFELIPQPEFAYYSNKTKVVKKTLYPRFDEKFTIALTKSQSEIEDALLKFTVCDFDLIGKNRYMADAFMRLSDATKSSTNFPRMTNLKLSCPKNFDSDILQALKYRKSDKQAKEFVKNEEAKMKCI